MTKAHRAGQGAVTQPSRRKALILGSIAAALAVPGVRRRVLWGIAAKAAEAGNESHGLSTFGELALPADFKHFDYVNPDAPKGGAISLQVNATAGNQNFTTFDTLNIYILKGNGAAGMGLIFDSLMTGSLDEPDALYGLVARAVQISPD